MDYIYTAADVGREQLAHHGIKGQHWGVRNYQNNDGSLTTLGRQHYGIGNARDRLAKRAKFGVALAKAKGEHYMVQAKKSIDRKTNPYDQSSTIEKYQSQKQQAAQQYSLQKQKEYQAKKYLETKKLEMSQIAYRDSLARHRQRIEAGNRYIRNMADYDYIMSDPTHQNHQSVKATLSNRAIAAKTFGREGADGLLSRQISYTDVNRYKQYREGRKYY